MIVLLHIFSWFWQWNYFENRLIFDEVKVYQKTVPFLGHPVCFSELIINKTLMSKSFSILQILYTINWTSPNHFGIFLGLQLRFRWTHCSTTVFHPTSYTQRFTPPSSIHIKHHLSPYLATVRHCRDTSTRDGTNVRLWHSAKAEGLGRLTERVPNVRPNFGRMLCARIKQRLILVSALSGQKMSQ